MIGDLTRNAHVAIDAVLSGMVLVTWALLGVVCLRVARLGDRVDQLERERPPS